MIAKVVATQSVAAVCLTKKSGPVLAQSGLRPGPVPKRCDRILYSNTANSRPKGHGFEPHRLHCVVSLSKTH